jgi:hypothetical protein
MLWAKRLVPADMRGIERQGHIVQPEIIYCGETRLDRSF